MDKSFDSIDSSNQKVIQDMIRVIFFITIPIFALSLLRSVEQGWLPTMGLHSFLMLGIFICYTFSKKIPLKVQSAYIVICFILLGLGTMINLKSFTEGSSFFLIALIFTMLFSSFKCVFFVAVFLSVIQYGFLRYLVPVPSIQDYLLLTSLPGLSFFAVYVVNFMRTTLISLIHDLEYAKKEAVLAMNARSQFLAIMSHEIRTPLSGVLMASELLLDSELTDSQQSKANIIQDNGKVLLTIVNDILDFSKIEAGKVKIDESIVDLRVLGQSVLESFKNQSRQSKVDIKLEIDAEFPNFVYADPTRIRQIIFNLVGNAFKFTKTGHIALIFQLIDKENDFSKVSISIEDTGIGIDSANFEYLFEDFHQLDNSITREYGGTGLGLSITKKLVDLLDGDISVKSNLGTGTTFTCTFKLRNVEREELIKHQSKENAVGLSLKDTDKIKTLIVEDNKVNQLLIKTLLDKWGFQSIATADNGLEAMIACRNKKFDLILMDMQMPEMDGVEATRRIRAGEADNPNTSTPIIAISANVSQEDIQICLDAGMNDYMSKPIDRNRLKEIIEKLFEAE